MPLGWKRAHSWLPLVRWLAWVTKCWPIAGCVGGLQHTLAGRSNFGTNRDQLGLGYPTICAVLTMFHQILSWWFLFIDPRCFPRETNIDSNLYHASTLVHTRAHKTCKRWQASMNHQIEGWNPWMIQKWFDSEYIYIYVYTYQWFLSDLHRLHWLHAFNVRTILKCPQNHQPGYWTHHSCPFRRACSGHSEGWEEFVLLGRMVCRGDIPSYASCLRRSLIEIT